MVLVRFHLTAPRRWSVVRGSARIARVFLQNGRCIITTERALSRAEAAILHLWQIEAEARECATSTVCTTS